MKNIFLFMLLFKASLFYGELKVGKATVDMTPSLTYSAGYFKRNIPMQGTHDPLLATAIFIDNGNQSIVFCGVDHLGFDESMVQEVILATKQDPLFAKTEVYIASSHTHAGCGCYYNVEGIGEKLAGPYDPHVRAFLIDKATTAIKDSIKNTMPAKLGVGHGKIEGLNRFRSTYPKNIQAPKDLTIIKITDLKDEPFAVIFNYACHPTLLPPSNLLFSADFIGATREYLRNNLENVTALFINGAIADVGPAKFSDKEPFEAIEHMGQVLGRSIISLWDSTSTSSTCKLFACKEKYSFRVHPTSQGLKVPFDHYPSEINLLVFNETEGFITIAAELSCAFLPTLESLGRSLGIHHLGVFGLTNGAHGYIITKEAFEKCTYESTLSFGGADYGNDLLRKIQLLLERSKRSN